MENPASTALAQTASPAPAPWQRWSDRLGKLIREPAVRRSLPAVGGIAAAAAAGGLYLALAAGPERVLYTELTDAERARVVASLDQAGIGYSIDTGTGVVSVAEEDVHRARMLVASENAISAPAGALEMLDTIPLGASRTMEGERLRLARERELMLTIREIDGVEAVRVHLATPERSAFIRQNGAPSASVMLRLASGRTLREEQVEAIVNLVSGSVPELSPDAVRIVDQNGRLLSRGRTAGGQGLVLQQEYEGKLREQVTALLLPLLGDGNFSAQVQVELNQQELTSARESFDREGALRRETARTAARSLGAETGGIPGVLSNTPPPPTELVEGAPPPAAMAQTGGGDSEMATDRAYELGREVAVASTQPGGLERLSVAVAVSDAALADAAPLSVEQLQALIEAAVGADEDRGDLVTVVSGAFEPAELEPLAFYETAWFLTLLRLLAGLAAIALVLFFAVRPALARLTDRSGGGVAGGSPPAPTDGHPLLPAESGSELRSQIELARQLAASQPDRAAATLRRMLQAPAEGSS
jgi:flagellar M-ring protein FliF